MKREKEPFNAVHNDVVIRASIRTEKMALFQRQNNVFGQVQTEQGSWRPSKKMFPGRDCYELPTYPRKPKGQK
ncbi:Conserved_hypothetical protein [Hexamita inflata]|uniref:Uncharacterized protein n=1 Tax=Hexamita inflata TaxID=28002 RepID=A0AA86N8B7_9EUKA|nr:Conserved hypothetical protein [Hexamita inflata]